MECYKSSLILYTWFLIAVTGETRIIKEFSIAELQNSILAANDVPVCVFYKRQGSSSLLEKKYFQFWKNRNSTLEYATWLSGIFPTNKHEFLNDDYIPIGDVPKYTPLVRCYIGYHTFDNNRTSIKSLNKWFSELVVSKKNTIPEATEELVLNKSLSSDLLVIGFANLKHHHQVELILKNIKIQWEEKNVDILFLHHLSEHSEGLAKLYGVRKKPAIVFIENTKKTKNKPSVVKVINPPSSTSESDIEMYLTLRFMDAVHANQHNYMAVCGIKSKFYVPILMLYYLPSSKSSHDYLSMFYRTVDYLQQLNLKMRFGTMKIDQTSGLVVSEHIKGIATNETLPLVVFLRSKWVKTTVVDIEQIFIRGRPTVSNIVKVLEEHNALLNALNQVVVPIFPWGTVTPNQLTSLAEGPNGTLCTLFSHNQTVNYPYVSVPKHKVYIKPKLKVTEKKELEKDIFGNWHDRFDVKKLDGKLPLEGEIHVVTSAMWQEVIEKSHVPLHPFYPGEKWQGEIVKTSLVIYITAECGNCKRKLPLFEALNKAVKFVDGGALYLANCTTDPQLCSQNNVTGFPTLVAYRGLGWIENMEHCSDKKIEQIAKPVEIEYHGVLSQKYVMDWFVTVSSQAVINVRNETLHPYSVEDPDSVRLVAKVVPRNSKYLLKITHSVITSVYPLECLRLACERLYGQIDCVLQYHPSVPDSHFDDKEQELVITEVTLERSDQFNAAVMALGKPLIDTMEGEAKSNAGTFHKPHKYKFPQGRIKCENAPAFCTDLIVDFSRDHGRLPVTKVSLKVFHTRNSLVFHENLPVLIALAYKENFSRNASFYNIVLDVAKELYDKAVVVTINVNEFSSWAHSFVPKGYVIFNREYPDEKPPLHYFPRFVVIYWHDHHHAAFYPHVSEAVNEYRPFKFTKAGILRFMQEFLKNPKLLLLETEHF